MRPRAEADAWEWLRNPMPPGAEKDPLFGFVRQDFRMADHTWVVDRSYTELDDFYRQNLTDRLTYDIGGWSFF